LSRISRSLLLQLLRIALQLIVGLYTAKPLTVSWWTAVAALEGLLGNCAAVRAAAAAL
jgi:hypothetical protein